MSIDNLKSALPAYAKDQKLNIGTLTRTTELNEEQLATVKGCDALLIPVGGYYTMDTKTAKKVADAIAPRVLVPMHYRFGAHGYPEIGTLDEFLALYEAKKIHKLDGNSFELTQDAPAGVIVSRFAE